MLWAAVAATALTAGLLPLSANASLPAAVTFTGVGGVVPGMRPAEINREWDVALQLGELLPTGSGECYLTRVVRGGMDGVLWFGAAKTLRAAWFRGTAKTDTGIRVGDSATRLRSVYGDGLNGAWFTDGVARNAYFWLEGSDAAVGFWMSRRWKVRWIGMATDHPDIGGGPAKCWGRLRDNPLALPVSSRLAPSR